MSKKFQIFVDREMLELLKDAAQEKRDHTATLSLTQPGAPSLKEEVTKLDGFIHDVDVLLSPKPRRHPVVKQYEKLKSTLA